MALNRLAEIGCCCDASTSGYDSGSGPSGYIDNPFGPCCCDRPVRVVTITDCIANMICPPGQCNNTVPYFFVWYQWRDALLGKQIVCQKFSEQECVDGSGGTTWYGCIEINMVGIDCVKRNFPACDVDIPNCNKQVIIPCLLSCSTVFQNGVFLQGAWTINIAPRLGQGCGPQLPISCADFPPESLGGGVGRFFDANNNCNGAILFPGNEILEVSVV